VQDGAMVRYAYEDFTPGQRIELGIAHVDREEMLAFARAFDPQPFHVDEQAAKASVLGGLCASGWFTCALWMKQNVLTVLSDSTSQGSPGGRELAWPAPVFPGDDLQCVMQINSVRVSAKRPDLGLVEFTGTAHRPGPDGADQLVLRITFTGIFGRERVDS
jgi:acyl dehydratase